VLKVRKHIEHKQQELREHPFVRSQQARGSLTEALWFAPQTAFWAMGFQDVIRINAERVTDSKLRRIVEHHRAEDAGHQIWYMHDLKAMGRSNIDIAWLFGDACKHTREATYAIMAEVLRDCADIDRVVLLLALEGAGHVLFGAVSDAIHKAGYSAELRYFSKSHLAVEVNHDLFEQDVRTDIDGVTLTPEQHDSATRLVTRVFDAVSTMVDGMMQPPE